MLVVGLARSGTSLVANLLNAQDGVTVYPDGVSAPLQAAQMTGGFASPLDDRQRNAALAALKHEHSYLGLTTSLTPADFTTAGELYTKALDELAADPDDGVVGHKVTGLWAIDPVLQWLVRDTDIRCVCVIRDPRGMALSQAHFVRNRLSPPEEWNAAAAALRRLADHPNVVALRFEDVLASPAETLAPVADLLGLDDLDTELPTLRHKDHDWIENSSFHDVRRPFDPAPAERWRDHCEFHLVRMMGWDCRAELARWNYPPFPTRLALAERLRFARRRTLMSLRRTLSSTANRLRSWTEPQV